MGVKDSDSGYRLVRGTGSFLTLDMYQLASLCSFGCKIKRIVLSVWVERRLVQWDPIPAVYFFCPGFAPSNPLLIPKGPVYLHSIYVTILEPVEGTTMYNIGLSTLAVMLSRSAGLLGGVWHP